MRLNEYRRSEDREYIVEEIGSQSGAQRLCMRSRAVDDDPLGGEQAVEPLPFGLLLIDDAVHLGLDLGELLPRRTAVGRRIVDALELLPLEARDADHEIGRAHV